LGISLIDLRCAGDPIKGIENRASGVMPVAKLLENSFSYANQLGSAELEAVWFG
jgi:ribonucleoside-diphosphate reductase alpha chain